VSTVRVIFSKEYINPFADESRNSGILASDDESRSSGIQIGGLNFQPVNTCCSLRVVVISVLVNIEQKKRLKKDRILTILCVFEVEKVKCLDGATKCPILKRGRLQKVKNLITKWQIIDSIVEGMTLLTEY
jgi:hypothetical protein